MSAEDSVEAGAMGAGCILLPFLWLVHLAAGFAALVALIGIFTSISFWSWAILAVLLEVGAHIVLMVGSLVGGALGWLWGRLTGR